MIQLITKWGLNDKTAHSDTTYYILICIIHMGSLSVYKTCPNKKYANVHCLMSVMTNDYL